MSYSNRITNVIISALPEGAKNIKTYENEKGYYWTHYVQFTLAGMQWRVGVGVRNNALSLPATCRIDPDDLCKDHPEFNEAMTYAETIAQRQFDSKRWQSGQRND